MDKIYHFLAVLPRSGNTLLSAIINQNPNIYSSPLSPLPTLIWDFENSCRENQHIIRNKENQTRSTELISSAINTFYKDVSSPIIIDREKSWGTPGNLFLIKKYITPTPKIIITVRDILEIIASFILMNPDYLKNEVKNSDDFINNYRLPNDIMVECLMKPNGDINKGLLSLASAFYPENKDIFHIVE